MRRLNFASNFRGDTRGEVRSPIFRFFPDALRAAVLFPCLSLTLLFTGCSNSMPGGGNNPPPTPPPTVTITANPTSIAAGSPSILTVVATHATQVTITGGGQHLHTGGQRRDTIR